jgi:hypothetical protein
MLPPMNDDEREASKQAIHRVAKQAADKPLALNDITEQNTDPRDGKWEGKLFRDDGLGHPGKPVIILWGWTFVTEETNTEIPFRVEVRFGNLARGLYCDVMMGLGEPLTEAHHVEVIYTGPGEHFGTIGESVGHLWPAEWFDPDVLQDADMEIVNSPDDPRQMAEPLEDSIFGEAMPVIDRGREEHAARSTDA